MSLRTILVPVPGDDNEPAALETALKLADKFKSHLTALHVRPDPRSAIPFIGEGLTAEVVQDLCAAAEREGKAKAKVARDLFDGLVQKYGLAPGDGTTDSDSASIEWDEHVGFFSERLGRQARLADLTVVPRPSIGGKPPAESGEFLNEVLFRSGRPLMLAPPSAPETLASRILVAWNGRAECARSVAAALPLMERADHVQLLTVGEEHEERPTLEALRKYLACHGISAETSVEDSGDKSISRTILDAAARDSADTLVMGAYSHSRWREMVLGGVTRDVIDHADIPVFMSH